MTLLSPNSWAYCTSLNCTQTGCSGTAVALTPKAGLAATYCTSALTMNVTLPSDRTTVSLLVRDLNAAGNADCSNIFRGGCATACQGNPGIVNGACSYTLEIGAATGCCYDSQYKTGHAAECCAIPECKWLRKLPKPQLADLDLSSSIFPPPCR